VGHEYFCVREEFLQAEPKPFDARVGDVLITFGGADSEDLTSRTLAAIWPDAAARGIRVHVVTGMGYAHAADLDALVRRIGSPLLSRANGTKRMSDFMARADVAFSSTGRTLFELATLRVPAIVMACNAREETHPFARAHAGFIYLGRHDRVSDDRLRQAFVDVVDAPARRQAMRAAMEQFDFRHGKARVLAELASALGAPLN
jgi:spore coat polysaccharide biosynthesis predicted glycosyltransferase SpsG